MTHRSRLAGFIIDCKDAPVEESARFWSAALGFDLVDPNEGGAGRYAVLGAREISRPHDARWVVMQAPTGQRFCVVRMKQPGKGARPNVWAD